MNVSLSYSNHRHVSTTRGLLPGENKENTATCYHEDGHMCGRNLSLLIFYNYNINPLAQEFSFKF
jgi:hypothetical protein